MNITKAFFIIALLILNMACFAANADDEERELNATILQPIINHFPEENSSTRIISKQIISSEKILKKQITKDDAEKLANELIKDPELNRKKCFIKEARRCMTCINDFTAENVTQLLLLSWRSKIADCGEFAHLALLVFEFNQMNHIALQVPSMFKSAIIVKTHPATGDHDLVLVEGKSGTMFAVDPWLRLVTRLDSDFTRLSKIDSSVYEFKNHHGLIKLNQKLNLLFKDTYYDAKFVNEDTQWYLERIVSTKIKKIAWRPNSNTQQFYEELRPDDVPIFPKWQLDYDTLFKYIKRLIYLRDKAKSKCAALDFECKKINQVNVLNLAQPE